MSGAEAAIVVISSIAGAAAGTAIGYAIHSRFFPLEIQNGTEGNWSQAQYMREVRLRYAEHMAYSNGYGRRWREITGDAHS